MATVLLVRHGRTEANATGILAGRTPGVHLDSIGREQAEQMGERLGAVSLAKVVSSPLERCRETAHQIVSRQPECSNIAIEPAFNECDYGQWQGRKLSELATEDLWSVVQNQPAAVRFPHGESLLEMQARAVSAIRNLDAHMETSHGPTAVWAAVSHGDVIKSVLADALGMHLDAFQRLNVNPASVSIIRYGRTRPDVIAVNTDAGDLSWLAKITPSEDAAVGGGAGPESQTSARS